MSAYSEEQRVFINNMKLEGKTITEIQDAFKEKFNRTPAPVTINKYGRYHLWAKDRDDVPDEPDGTSKESPKDEEKKDGVLEIDVKDTRKDKKPKDEIVHFSDGQMDDKAFAKIVALRGTNEEETFNFLKSCGQKGYTKINMKTGDISE